MQFDVDNLPSEPALLQHLLREMAVAVEHRDGEIERLKSIIKKLQRAQFGFRLSCALSAPRVPNTPAGPARRWRKRRLRSGRSPAAWRRRRCSPRCWSADIAITRRSIESQIFARHGVDLPRSTLAGWVGGACWWLEALHERLARNVFASDHLFADDTPVPVLDPGRGRTKTGRCGSTPESKEHGAGRSSGCGLSVCAGSQS